MLRNRHHKLCELHATLLGTRAQVHIIAQSQTEQLHQSMGWCVRRRKCCGVYHQLLVTLTQVHTILQSQTEQLHHSMGIVREAPPLVVRPPPPVSDSEGEHDFSDQLLETWMLLEYCDQGNLESAAREARFKNDFVSACCPYRHCFVLYACRYK